MARKASLSGFPEYLPAERLVENHVLDTLRETFELHGFSPIETRSVETIEQLLRKGEIDKEVYAISRLQEDEAAKAKEKLALHSDRAVCPLCGGERRLPEFPVLALPDSEGVAW